MGELAKVLLTDEENRALVRHAFYGSHGFSDGSYLVKYDRENDANYTSRKRLAYYFNYTKPLIEGAVDPVFREYPSRVAANKDQRWDAFLIDVDGKGTPIDKFMAKAALNAKIDGSIFIVVDNQTDGIADNLAESLEKRQFPYLYTLKDTDVISYTLDRYDRLILITYRITYEVIEDGKPRTVAENWTWTKDTWKVLKDGVETQGVNSIGEIPIIPLVGANIDDRSEDKLRPMSDFLHIAKANKVIFNACSELRQRNRSQAFSMLVYPVPEDENPDKYKQFVTGANNALLYKGGTPPGWITPDRAPSDMLKDEIYMLVEGMYRAADRSSVTGVQSQSSGIAKEWDNFTRMQSISAFSKVCEQAEDSIATIFGLYINKDLNVTVEYAKDFGITDTVAELDKITTALDLEIGGKFDTKVKVKAARLVLKDNEDKEIQEVVEDIEKRAADEDYSKTSNNDNDNNNE